MKVIYYNKLLREYIGKIADIKFGQIESYAKNVWILKEYKHTGAELDLNGESVSEIFKVVFDNHSSYSFNLNKDFKEIFKDDFDFSKFSSKCNITPDDETLEIIELLKKDSSISNIRKVLFK